MKLFSMVLLLLSGAVTQAGEPIRVVTSTTDLAWAVKEIAGNHVDVKSFLKGTENPHYIDAVPEFIRLSAEAKAAFVVGLDLEIGWMPKVLARSGNAQVQPGGKGYAEVGKAISVLEKPAGAVDRSMGDVHPQGNPHFWLSPNHFAQGAKVICETLSGMDPVHVLDYQNGLKRFQELMTQIHKKNERKLHLTRAALGSGPVLIEYHKEFAYFLEAYQLKSLGSIEEKPGITPSAGRLAEMALAAKNAGVRFVLAAETSPKKTLDQFSELSGLPVVTVPMSLHGEINDYARHQDLLMDLIVKVLTAGQKASI